MSKSNAYLTVTKLNQIVRELLEQHVGQVWLVGEISNFSQPVSGHWYFSLKDRGAQVRCAMFRNNQKRALLKPQNGQQVLARAILTLYEARGEYQLVIESLQMLGDGLMQQKFEQLKQKLQTEGLFEPSHKKPLPQPVQQVGIITSATGAALQDILQILARRDPSLPIIIYPTLVQGKEATEAVAKALEIANSRHECDVLIVARGGGSLEDLWCFNEERVARAIFASQIPIISAVGHEIDVTIADFVADMRAPTPSAAAELVSRDRTELLRQLVTQQQRLEMGLDYFLHRQQQALALLNHRLQQQHPQMNLARQQHRLLQLTHQLEQLTLQHLTGAKQRYHFYQQRIWQLQPLVTIQRLQHNLRELEHRLSLSVERQFTQVKQQFSLACSQLDAVSPLATLARGYSVTETAPQQLLRSVQQVALQDQLTTHLVDGTLISEVRAIKPHS